MKRLQLIVGFLVCMMAAIGILPAQKVGNRWALRAEVSQQRFIGDFTFQEVARPAAGRLLPAVSVGIERTWVSSRVLRFYQDLSLTGWFYAKDYFAPSIGTNVGLEVKLMKYLFFAPHVGLGYRFDPAPSLRWMPELMDCGNGIPRIGPYPNRPQGAFGFDLGVQLSRKSDHPISVFATANRKTFGWNYYEYSRNLLLPNVVIKSVGMGLRVGL